MGSEKMNETAKKVAQTLIKLLTYQSVITLLILPLSFLYLNHVQPHYYVDEKFHIPQAQRFCEGRFEYWDPKITTLPGLYLASWLLLSPIKWCTTFAHRLINLGFTFLNLYLTCKLMDELQRHKRKSKPENFVTDYLAAYNITLFPPLFFWFFLYYTDIFSITTVLLMLLFYTRRKNELAAGCGALSVLVRQTNIVWVGLIAVECGLNVVERTLKDARSTDSANPLPYIKKFITMWKLQAKLGLRHCMNYSFGLCRTVLPYVAVIFAFGIFVIWNGGIVVGDKTAHIPVVHFTQILYYSAFTFCFAWPYMVVYLKEFVEFVKHNFIPTLFFLGVIIGAIHYNTLTHPYLLADNRHFTFYLWKDIINRTWYSKYLLAPFYFMSIFCFLKSIVNLRLMSRFTYLMCICMVLVPQLLLEPRYFIVPYVLFRLAQQEPQPWQLVAETITTNTLNYLQFFIFSYKSFYWEDEAHPQRIGW